MSTFSNRGPLTGIRVIDFGQYVAGPGAAMMLADQGAEVIRIERPDGPSMQSPANAVLNRGKRIVRVDLKTPAGLQVAWDFSSGADVLIENFRPGVMSRLGLGEIELRHANPRLVYLSLPGFSRADEQNCDLPAWEGVIAAATGQFTDMGLNRVLMGIQASYSPLTLASAYGSVLGALSVVLALRARERDGVGDYIEVPLAAALMEGLAYNSLSLDGLPLRYKSLREREIERRRAAGLPMNLSYEQLQPLLDPFYRTYTCRDGRPFYVVSEAHATHSERALKILGLWDEMLAEGVPTIDPYLHTRHWPPGTDCTIRAHPLTEPWSGYLTRRMAAAFLTRDSADWEYLFGQAGAPAAAHRTTNEWLHSSHARQASLIVEVLDREYGTMLQPGPVAWLESSPPDLGGRESPQAPAQTLPSTMPTPAGATSTPPSAMPTPPSQPGLPWLQGITILDLTNVIAGPTVAGTLARFGARVIKVDPVIPTYDPWNTIICGIHANQGKESALINLKTAAGQEALHRLVQRVDVITINATSAQLAPLGLDFKHLQSINPRIVLCHLDAFGGPTPGPRSDYPGYDDLVQASTGIMERFGGSLSTVEEHAHFGTIDVLAGISAAFAVSLALLKRQTTGIGDVARSSLAAAGQWLQVRFMYDYEGRAPFNEPRGRDAKGESPLYRCYEASDGWFFLAGHPGSLRSLQASKLLGQAAAAPTEQRETLLQHAFISRPVAFWKEHLVASHVVVQPLERMAAVRSQSIRASGGTITFRRTENHPCGRAVEQVEPTAVRSSRAPLVALTAAEKYGTSTRRLMRELGFPQSEISAWLQAQVISESWCDDYLPD